ncbi:MAG: lipase maturation factor family protein [Candidatus Obscuribacterales bacterium]|nr:lipase maturation factor family protein [Candidatus Obscuribacterales bacterium]
MRKNRPILHYRVTAQLFLRILGLTYFFAFASFGTQVTGLIGQNGILPASRFLARVNEVAGPTAFLQCPSIFLVHCTDWELQLSCLTGAVGGVLMFLGFFPSLLLFAVWFIYLSLMSAGNVFMGFQWDSLLMETGFLALFLFPGFILPSRKSLIKTPAITVIWLIRLLAFKLMLLSGAVKLLSGDSTWRDLTAMSFHYFTQPIPNVVAWYAHQLPIWWHKWETAIVLFIELVIPFLIFAPRPARLAGGAVLLILQMLIMLSGNYAFFNWLTIALCISIFDDAFFRSLLPRTMRMKHRFGESNRYWTNRRRMLRSLRATALVTLLILGLTLVNTLQNLSSRFGVNVPVPEAGQAALALIRPFHIMNNYGLFAVMTTNRPEIIIEGSNDGLNWKAYEFKYKPGALDRMPPCVAPHQPRLDWQMWFAALGSVDENPWVVNLAVRLLQGSPEVLSLLQKNPFPGHPPRFIRANSIQYEFTTADERQRTNHWWKTVSDPVEYMPGVSIQQ